MINVTCADEKIIYNAYHLVKAFYPEAEVKSSVDEGQKVRIVVNFDEGKCVITSEDIAPLYIQLRDMTGTELPWGMLMGVRPIKLATKWLLEHIKEGQELTKADKTALRAEFTKWIYLDRFVGAEKAGLAIDVALKEHELLKGTEGGYSLYVGIPFCPSVCSYCSFSSGEIGSYTDKVEAYIKALSNELQQKSLEVSPFRYPDTVYFGGGTPTSLDAKQLDFVLSQADKFFHIQEGLSCGKIREFTVEAGRPDSITRQKLEVLKRHNVSRISINPQTMQQKTLDLIGRKHTTRQIVDTYYMARELGFDNINMDLIMGLQEESNEDVRDTLQQIRQLSPDSLTVHSLAVKRASKIGIGKRTGRHEAYEEAGDISEMIRDAYEISKAMGMEPYYLYRQKSIAGNFENIGYAKPGKEGLYNVLIMEEVQSIIACGAGASSKVVLDEPVPNPKRKGQYTYMIRSENPKSIEHYIERYI